MARKEGGEGLKVKARRYRQERRGRCACSLKVKESKYIEEKEERGVRV